MKCPFCQSLDSRVIDSRLSNESDMIRRRRECEKCLRRFTTYERVEETLPMVVKKDGSRQPFDRLKVFHGVQRACEKRPVSSEQMNLAARHVEEWIQEQDVKEISSLDVGERVMKELKALDEVAYVRFASVYRSFRDVNEFVSEVQRMLQKP